MEVLPEPLPGVDDPPPDPVFGADDQSPWEPVLGDPDQPHPGLEPDQLPLPDDGWEEPQPPLQFHEPFHDQLWAMAF